MMGKDRDILIGVLVSASVVALALGLGLGLGLKTGTKKDTITPDVSPGIYQSIANAGIPWNMCNPNNDCARVPIDAVVNAANLGVCTGRGVTGALVQAVGGEDRWNLLKTQARLYNPSTRELEPYDKLKGQDCNYNYPLTVCQVVVTPTAGSLKAGGVKWIIHAPGPNQNAGDNPAEVKTCFSSILGAANALGVKFLATPFLSTGIFGATRDAPTTSDWKEKMHKLAIEAVTEYYTTHTSPGVTVFIELPDQGVSGLQWFPPLK